jgi:hypothetical protein
MSVFKHKGRRIYYCGFGARGRYFVRSTGTANRRKALRMERELRALAAAGKLRTPSPDERRRLIARSLRDSNVKRDHRAKIRETANRREADPEAKREWIDSIKSGQSEPAVKSKMDEARLRTNSDPAYRKLRRRSQKKVWKRRGHKARVSRSMKNKWATEEFRTKNLAGRDLAAADRLGRRGFSIGQSQSSDRPGGPRADVLERSKTRQRRRPKPQDLTEPFRIGSMVEQKIGAGPRTRRAVVSARFDVAAETDLEYDTVKKYHLAHLRETGAVPDRKHIADE